MKNILVFCFFLYVAISIVAKPIDFNQAIDKAKAFLQQKNVNASAELANGIGVRSNGYYEGDELSDYYVFNATDGKGFVIVAGDDRVPAILGYSDQGNFDADNIPEGVALLLQEYSAMIDDVRTTGESIVMPEAGNAIEPLIKSAWGQNDPYNQSCPLFANGNRCLTGCVATAMGQVLRYYGNRAYKSLQKAIASYNCRTNWTNYGYISVNGANKRASLDWYEMPDDFTGSSSSAQKKAVANLLAYCGAAVKMEYRDNANGGSSASAANIPYALINYFGYKSTVRNVVKTDYQSQAWADLIYNELENGRPVIISGTTSTGSGHTFVCDGFDGNKMFHINWGWLGNYDGYFLLTALTPANTPGGYNNYGEATIGIEPIMPSDVNRDGGINGADVVGLYNFISIGTSSGVSSTVADVNQDYQVNGADVVNVYNDIMGDAGESGSSKVLASVKTKGNAHTAIKNGGMYYLDDISITNNLSGAITLKSVDLYINGQFYNTLSLNKTINPKSTDTTCEFSFQLLYVASYTTKIKFEYQGVEYEMIVDTPVVVAQ